MITHGLHLMQEGLHRLSLQAASFAAGVRTLSVRASRAAAAATAGAAAAAGAEAGWLASLWEPFERIVQGLHSVPALAKVDPIRQFAYLTELSERGIEYVNHLYSSTGDAQDAQRARRGAAENGGSSALLRMALQSDCCTPVMSNVAQVSASVVLLQAARVAAPPTAALRGIATRPCSLLAPPTWRMLVSFESCYYGAAMCCYVLPFAAMCYCWPG